jgi:hypothetical protein
VPDLSPAHATNWHLRQLQLKSLSGRSPDLGKHKGSMSAGKGIGRLEQAFKETYSSAADRVFCPWP